MDKKGKSPKKPQRPAPALNEAGWPTQNKALCLARGVRCKIVNLWVGVLPGEGKYVLGREIF